jgi:hypothetical protein
VLYCNLYCGFIVTCIVLYCNLYSTCDVDLNLVLKYNIDFLSLNCVYIFFGGPCTYSIDLCDYEIKITISVRRGKRSISDVLSNNLLTLIQYRKTRGDNSLPILSYIFSRNLFRPV